MRLNHIERGLVEHIDDVRVELARYQGTGTPQKRIDQFVAEYLTPLSYDIADLTHGQPLGTTTKS